VTQLFPKLRLRATTAPHTSPVHVSFEELIDATRRLPTTMPPGTVPPPADSAVEVEFEVTHCD